MSEARDRQEWQHAHYALLDWMDEERPYVIGKWGESKHEAQLTYADIERDVMMYVHRAFVLGLDNPLGRQALLKGYSTLNSYVEAMIRVYGQLPIGGVPSGYRAEDTQ